ncbi:MAG: response regulator transcription factor [Pleurocapsa sp.]
MIRVLLVDDQNLVRQGIKSLLEQDSNLQVVGTVKDGRNAIKQVELLSPDIVLLDIEMPTMDGITATKYINHSFPQTKVIILSSHEDEEYLTQAFMAGAKAYILKDSLITDLTKTIVAVNNGYSHIESRLLAKIFASSNFKFHSRFTAIENERINHHSQKFTDSIVKNPQPIKASDNKETEAKSTISIPSIKQPLLSPGEVSQVSVSEASSPEKSDSEINDSKLNLSKTVVENKRVEPRRLNHSNSQFNYNIWSKLSEEKSLSSVANQFTPVPMIQDSASKRALTSASSQNQSKVVLKGKNYLRQITNQPPILKYKTKISQFYQSKALQYEPQIKLCQAKLVYYQSRLFPIIKRWYQKGWLADAGLVFLGIITVMIIHQVFS